ncbi:MAG: hypothetical protein ACRCVN_05910 [Spirochaetia bacterium]
MISSGKKINWKELLAKHGSVQKVRESFEASGIEWKPYHYVACSRAKSSNKKAIKREIAQVVAQKVAEDNPIFLEEVTEDVLVRLKKEMAIQLLKNEKLAQEIQGETLDQIRLRLGGLDDYSLLGLLKVLRG